MSIGNVIFELRTERNLSQKQVAEAIQISQSTIAKIEINRNEATASTIRKLAVFFGVSTDYLLELENDFGVKLENSVNNSFYSEEEKKLVEDFRSLSAPGRQLVKTAVKTLIDTSTQK